MPELDLFIYRRPGTVRITYRRLRSGGVIVIVIILVARGQVPYTLHAWMVSREVMSLICFALFCLVQESFFCLHVGLLQLILLVIAAGVSFLFCQERVREGINKRILSIL